MSAQINDYDLIMIVESFPILYDKNLARGQKNAALKDKAWTAVSLKMNASERACITRWKSIRDRFGKEYRRAIEHPNEPTCSWDMFQHLLFLKDHYKQGHASQDAMDIKYEPKQRRRKSMRRDKGDNSQDEEDYEEDPEEVLANQQLIALVKEHPVLYDKQKIRDSKNLTAKNDAWTEIAITMGVSEEICYLRWKKLRDRFAREYRHQQLEPEKPIEWIYFPHLIFLGDHYRKGIPLNVEELRQKARARALAKQQNDEFISEAVDDSSPWGMDYPPEYNTVVDGGDIEQDQGEQYQDLQTLDELLIIPKTPHKFRDDSVATSLSSTRKSKNVAQIIPLKGMSSNASEPEQHLTHVINNIETILRQSQEALQSVQQQKQKYREELESMSGFNKPGMLGKINCLLDGLNGEERIKAERKILQFLCECQIRTLNNQEIDDIMNMDF